MAVLQDININVHGQPSEKRLQTFLRLSQNENGRMINFRVLGPPLPSGCTATFSGTKPDGNVYSKTGTVAGNFVVIQEDMQMTAVAGVWDAKLDIVNGSHNIMTALIRVVIDADVVDPDAIASDSQLQGLVAEAKYYAEHARTDAYGSPLTAPTKAQMTDHTRVYVYTGSEPNMVAGNWYLWDGTAWISGGVYNSVAVQSDSELNDFSTNPVQNKVIKAALDQIEGAIPEIDATLSTAGKAADAKKTGDEISGLKEDLNAMQDALLVTDAQALTWHQGSINGSTGTAISSGTRCYTDHVKVEHSAYALTIPSGYKYYIYEYTSASASGYVGPYISDWQTGTVWINVAIGRYIRFICAYTDDAAITPSDITGVALTYGDYTDQTLSMSGKAADAKVVGDKIGTAEKNAYDSILNLMAFCPNLFSVYSADYQSGKGYSGKTGNIVNATANCISGYIRVSAGDYLQIFANKINVLNRRVDGEYRKLAYYDTTKTWVKTEIYSDNTTGPDALRIETDGYIRVMFRLSDLREIFVSSVRRDKLVDLLVFAGQSNMAGRGETNSSFPESYPRIILGAGYEFKSITDPTKLYPLEEPFGYAENAPDDESGIYDGTKKTGDMVASFVNAYFTNNGKIPAVCISASEGGSSSAEWQPETGNNFIDLSERVTLARSWLVDNGYPIRHQYCLWCQGESDGDDIAAGRETFEEYKTRARAIFNGLIALGLEKVLLVRIGNHNSGSSTRYTNIIHWQTEEAQTNDALVMVSCDFAGMRSKSMMKDAFHYYQIGYNITGNSAGVNEALFANTGK